MSLSVFGKNPSGKRLQRIEASPNYREGAFKNQSPTPMMADDVSYAKMFREYFGPKKDATPATPLTSVKTDLHNIHTSKPFITWFGHSSYFLSIAGITFLVDPVFSGSAAPFSFMVKSFPGTNLYQVSDLPPIDYLIITHDHYDHLDFKTIVQLKEKVNHVICSLGVGAHLEHWGYATQTITELDWWQSEQLSKAIKITATPARHFSGRTMTRGKTFWSSFVLNAGPVNIFLGGDSGYDQHFKKIGDEFGPFDLAILECGQYNPSWPLIHMMPEETVKAAIDLKAKCLLPVHWGKFMLAFHPWSEPVKRAVAKAAEMHLQVTTPMIGQPVVLGQSYPVEKWYEM